MTGRERKRKKDKGRCKARMRESKSEEEIRSDRMRKEEKRRESVKI